VAKVVAAGVGLVILREKDASEEELLTLALKAQQASLLTRPQNSNTAIRLIINTNLTVAAAVKAYGLHLPFAKLNAQTVHQAQKLGLRVGVSVHSLEEAQAAEKAGADWLMLGPIFPTNSKPGHHGLGLEFTRALKKRLTRPLWLVGGIEPSVIRACFQAGADKVCLRSSLMAAPEPSVLINKLLFEAQRD
jgi:thiamine-phosphate diphosphorylase